VVSAGKDHRLFDSAEILALGAGGLAENIIRQFSSSIIQLTIDHTQVIEIHVLLHGSGRIITLCNRLSLKTRLNFA
jgi:hypothetical protein